MWSLQARSGQHPHCHGQRPAGQHGAAQGCYYINIREALTNPADGSQIDDYATKDGVHFNAAGYHAWAEYLATHTVWNRRSVYSGENPYYIYGT